MFKCMGFLRVVLVQIYLPKLSWTNFETIFLEKLDYFAPVTNFRNVDDISATISRDKSSQMVHVFDSYDERLKFTYELENNNSISFLKPKISGRLLNYSSKHLFAYKKNKLFTIW